MPQTEWSYRGFWYMGAVVAMAAASCLGQTRDPDGPRVSLISRAPRPTETGSSPNLRAGVKVVLIPVTVTDPYGAPYSGLKAKAFRLFENGIEQQVNYFSAVEAPISVGIVFDASRSMEDKIDDARAGVKQFLQTAIEGDEFSLVAFNDVPRILSGFTTNPIEIERRLLGLTTVNWTALLDAVYMSVQQMKRARNPRKALLIVSDGGDNHSRYTESEMRAVVREADVCIYSIAFIGAGFMKSHARLLKKLSDETGGLTCEVQKLNELPDAVTAISSAIRTQYLLGYVSTNTSNNGLYRKVEVKLNPPADSPRLRPAWRMGYYAPADF